VSSQFYQKHLLQNSAHLIACEKNRVTAENYDKGQSIKSIADQLNVTSAAVRARIIKHRIALSEKFLKGVSARCRNALRDAGFKTDEEVKGKFQEDPLYFLKLRNFGKLSYDELVEFIDPKPDVCAVSIWESLALIESEIKKIKIQLHANSLGGAK
jgi:hypothetical protein